MIKEIAPNVYWIETSFVNLYLLNEEDELTLIDTGMRNRKGGAFINEALAEIGRSVTDIKRILITHVDIDHIGNLADIAEKSGATVYAGDVSAKLINTGEYPSHLTKFQEWLLNTFMRSTPYPEAKIKRLNDGDVLPILGGTQVLATPGHTPEHFSFYNPQTGVLIVGDALRTSKDGLQLTPKGITADMTAAKESAIRLLKLAPAVFACGHGTPKSDQSMGDIQMLFDTLRADA